MIKLESNGFQIFRERREDLQNGSTDEDFQIKVDRWYKSGN